MRRAAAVTAAWTASRLLSLHKMRHNPEYSPDLLVMVPANTRAASPYAASEGWAVLTAAAAASRPRAARRSTPCTSNGCGKTAQGGGRGPDGAGHTLPISSDIGLPRCLRALPCSLGPLIVAHRLLLLSPHHHGGPRSLSGALGLGGHNGLAREGGGNRLHGCELRSTKRDRTSDDKATQLQCSAHIQP